MFFGLTSVDVDLVVEYVLVIYIFTTGGFSYIKSVAEFFSGGPRPCLGGRSPTLQKAV
jgi:hypothetical protein